MAGWDKISESANHWSSICNDVLTVGLDQIADLTAANEISYLAQKKWRLSVGVLG